MRACLNSIILFCFILIFNSKVIGQGGWFIEYIPFDSLSSQLIGKEIRIDFKSSQSDSLEEYLENGFDIRELLIGKDDTVELFLSGKSVNFKESWKLQIDYGSLRDQTLNSLNSDQYIQIKEMFIESINEYTLGVEAILYYSKGYKKKEKIDIPISIIKGILVKAK